MELEREPAAGDLSGFYYHREFGLVDQNDKALFDAKNGGAQKKGKQNPADNKVAKEFLEYLDQQEEQYDAKRPVKEDGMRGVLEDVESSGSASYNSDENQKKKKKEALVKVNNLEPERENLKHRTMAKYKAVLDGEIQMYTDIENRMINLAQCKGIAAGDDSSLEEFEEELQEQLTKRKKMCNQSDYDGRRSSNSEMLKSVRSSKNYWQGYDLINMPKTSMSPNPTPQLQNQNILNHDEDSPTKITDGRASPLTPDKSVNDQASFTPKKVSVPKK